MKIIEWFRKFIGKNRVYESMTKTHILNTYPVRVWVDEGRPTFGPNKDVLKAFDVINDPATIMALDDILEFVEKRIPTMSAIEILDKHGNGIVYYPDWR